MNSLKDYSLNITEKDYHAYPAWSHSLIARYARDGFQSISTLHEPITPTPSMEFGSLFDTILTRGKKAFEAEYVILDTTPPNAEKAVMDCLAKLSDGLPFYSIPEGLVKEAIAQCKYQQNWKYDTQYKHLEPFEDYYEKIKDGKKVITRADFEDAAEMARVFRNDEYLSKIFGTKNTNDVEYIYQAQFCEDYLLDSGKEIRIKIMPDLLIVNHNDMTIQPVDLKTSAMPAYDFAENFIKFRYDLEAEVYTDVLELVKDKDMDYRNYTILPYLFTDISRTDKVPVTYVYDPKNGFSFENNGREYKYKGWQELLEEILVYEEEQAKVPSYINTTGPNDIISILSKK